MKALRKMQPARGLSFEGATVPAIGPTDVLVRVRTASICGTDLHIYGWDRWSQGRIKPPVTLGHEFCGVVERVGDEVTAVTRRRFRQRRNARQLRALSPVPRRRSAHLPEPEDYRDRPGRGVRGVRQDSGVEHHQAGRQHSGTLRRDSRSAWATRCIRYWLGRSRVARCWSPVAGQSD